MKSKKVFNVAINGFGRIGRNVLRGYFQRLANLAKHQQEPIINIVAINDLAEASTLLHLLKYDSTHGRLDEQFTVTLENSNLLVTIVNQQYTIQLFQQQNPQNLPWQALNIDVVLECTGCFRSYEQAYQHILAGAKQVIIGAAPFDTVDASIVLGVNEHELTLDKTIISSVSCTTQALVPLLNVLDNAYQIQSAMMTEIHAVTADQTVLDQVHRDLRRARASGHNIIPTTSSSIAAVSRVLPHMAGKINGYSIRVPTINVAAIDVTMTFVQPTTPKQVNQQLKLASEQQYQGIMGYSDEPLVSSDFIRQPQSLVIDSLQTMQVGEQLKVFAWYDNEWGYTNRLLDMCEKLAKLHR